MSFTVENIFNEGDRFDKCSAHNGHSELAQRLNPDTSRIREIFLIDNRQNIQLCGHREGRREGSERELVGIIYTNRIWLRFVIICNYCLSFLCLNCTQCWPPMITLLMENIKSHLNIMMIVLVILLWETVREIWEDVKAKKPGQSFTSFAGCRVEFWLASNKWMQMQRVWGQEAAKCWGPGCGM